MGADPRLESYLSQLERVLLPFPTSDRAEIVLEIKSHILSALERNPNQSLDSVLAALGEPQTVANRYLIERGMQPAKPPVSPVVKWLVIGFLGTFALVLLFAGALAWKFSPVLRVDEGAGRVTILGGLIDVDEQAGTVRIGGAEISEGRGRVIEGVRAVRAGLPIRVDFRFGKVEARTSTSSEFRWSCRLRGTAETGEPFREADSGYALDLSDFAGAKCTLDVPEGMKLIVRGQAGKIAVAQPLFALDAELASGKIAFDPARDQKYRFDVQVRNGKADAFDSSSAPEAREIRLRLENGKISHGGSDE